MSKRILLLALLYLGATTLPLFAPVTPQVPLARIAPTTTNTVIVYWQSSVPGFIVQQLPAFHTTNTWSDMTNVPALLGTNYQVVLPTTPAPRFFRLVHH